MSCQPWEIQRRSAFFSLSILCVWGAGMWSESEVAQLCLALCDPMDCSPPGSSVHGIFQSRVLEWLAISFSRGSSRPRDWTLVSRIVGRHFTIWATREAPYNLLWAVRQLYNIHLIPYPPVKRERTCRKSVCVSVGVECGVLVALLVVGVLGSGS